MALASKLDEKMVSTAARDPGMKPRFPYKILSDTIIANVLEQLPESIISLMEQYNIVLAGGFIRAVVAKEPPRDIDIFVMEPTEQERKQVAKQVIREVWDQPVHASLYAFTAEPSGMPPVQLVHYWPVDTPEDLLDRFDFTICEAAMWFDGSFPMPVGICSSMFMDDSYSKTIRYADPIREPGELNVADSIKRAFRFRDRGYTLPIFKDLS